MKRLTTMHAGFGVALMTSALMVACSDRTERDSAEAADQAAVAAEKAGDVAQDVGRDIANATSDAAQSAQEAGASGARAADAAVQTLDVKTALTLDSRVDASGINVDTDDVTKTVFLKGRVPTANQKLLAEQIAADKAVGYRVKNELVVGS